MVRLTTPFSFIPTLILLFTSRLWRLTSFELLCRMCDHVVLNKQQCSTIIVHITEDMDSLFISRAEKGGIDLQSQQDVSLDATTGTITDNFNVTEKMVLLAEYSLKRMYLSIMNMKDLAIHLIPPPLSFCVSPKVLNYLLVSSSDHDGILSSSLFSMIVSINLGTPRLCRLFAAHPALLILSLRTLHACVLVQPANRTVLGVALKVFGAHLQSRDSAVNILRRSWVGGFYSFIFSLAR